MIPNAYRNSGTSRFIGSDRHSDVRRSDLMICLILSVTIVSMLMAAL